MSKGNPRDRVHRREESASEGEKCELARRREGGDGDGRVEGIREWSSQQSVSQSEVCAERCQSI